MPTTETTRPAVVRWMRAALREGEYIDEHTGETNLTGLTEGAAVAFGQADPDGWLDDSDHWIWDAAIEAAEAEGGPSTRSTPRATPGEASR